MHQPSRRQFVVAATAGVPLLFLEPPSVVAQLSSFSDPVLEAIMADFGELRREGDAQPSQRRGAVRGMETLTGVLAAHLSQHYDADMKRALRQQLRRQGRQAFVQDIVTKANKPEFTHEKVDAMVTRLERDGLGGIMREIQKGIKRLRENLPADYLQVRSATQFDFCADVRWMIDLAEFSVALACSISVGFAGTNPAANASCAAAGAFLAGVLGLKWWYSC